MRHPSDGTALLPREPSGGLLLAGRLAAAIPDPILRLRFLQTVVESPVAEGQRRRRILGAILAVCAVLLAGFATAAVLVRPLTKTPVPEQANLRRGKTRPARARTAAAPSAPVWLVERTADSEIYSNGLRVDVRFSIGNGARIYTAFPAGGPQAGTAVRRDVPAGIVFHLTESAQVPFEASRNGVLKKIGESLLDYVRRQKAYHFVIDRFGRVYKVVRETDVAYHAGHSVWADDRWVYINLNESFLGVAFEARSESAGEEPAITSAQIRAAANLTEMLRARFGIPAGNCVTHAQVSVNPSNRRVGYHTDWSSGFPYDKVGLPDNYDNPLPAVALFGFVCDRAFLDGASPRLKDSVRLAEDELATRAARCGLDSNRYRQQLQSDFRAKLAMVKEQPGRASP